MNQRRAPPERKNCTVSCDHVRTSISRITERTQTYGSIGTHQEQAPGYPYMSPFSHRATITVGATLLTACLTRSNPRQSFAIRTHVGRTHKFQVVAVEGVQGRAGERAHEEVGTFHEEVHQGFNVTRSQCFISVCNSFIYGTPSTVLVISTSFRMGHLHHDNAQHSNLFINKQHNLRTQPCGWERRPRHERPTTHTPLQKNCPRKKAATIQPSKAGCQKPRRKTPNSANKNKNTTPYIAQAPPAYTHKATSTTTAVDIGVVP